MLSVSSRAAWSNVSVHPMIPATFWNDSAVLDEPTTGMDPMNRQSVWRLIQMLKRDAGVVLTTHDMSEANVLGACSFEAIAAHPARAHPVPYLS